jgi:1,4-alpha-glucan branching enzyme
MIDREELRRFHAGKVPDAYRFLGAHPGDDAGRSGVWFATWAPHAAGVSVVGDFNDWDGRRHPMAALDRRGMWGVFVPGPAVGAQYKFEIHSTNGKLVIKTDPYAQAFVSPSNTNAQVIGPSVYRWEDARWLAARAVWRWAERPLNIYEVHLGSWRRRANGSPLPYVQAAEELVEYLRTLEFTHVELLPIFEHPLVESLGYQVTGYFAPTSRFGRPDDFRAFVDRCHAGGIGVILDWVPLHFPKDEWGLAEFDGEPLYERDDPKMAEHPQWRTLIFNYGRPEVRNFLLANALYWLREFHVDGLRVDAVSSMLYLDDARGGAHFRPNPLGGRENLAAVRFLREMNAVVTSLVPDALTIAEESSSWPDVSVSPKRGGLGFSMKWNMGWVHDTLHYLRRPWSERPEHHQELTFERLYARAERYVLALSHDEGAPHRGPLAADMHGDAGQRLAQMRLLFTYCTTYPGKKLNFMGNEFASRFAWDPTGQLAWGELDDPAHAQVRAAVRDLNALYKALPALHRGDFESESFRWLDPDDARHCVLSYVRTAGEAFALVILNFSANAYEEYVVGTPLAGTYRTIFASDAPAYGGSGLTRLLDNDARDIPAMGCQHSLSFGLGPLAGAIVVPA